MIRAKASWKIKFSDNQVEQVMPGKFESRFSNRVFMSISVRTRSFYLQTVPSRLVPDPLGIKLNALVRTSEFRAIVNLDLWRSLWACNLKSHYLYSCTDYQHVFDFQWGHASDNQLGFPYLFQDVSMIYLKMEYWLNLCLTMENLSYWIGPKIAPTKFPL
jgi:hypothetical protein